MLEKGSNVYPNAEGNDQDQNLKHNCHHHCPDAAVWVTFESSGNKS